MGLGQTPLVSVVITTRNRREALSTCLKALAGQSLERFEILVVDDASTDDTESMVSQFATAHPDRSLRFLRVDSQIGANPCRNRGIRESRADLVAFTDDDCVPDERWLEQLAAGFNAGSVAAVTGRTETAPPRNIFELMHKGTQRVHSPDGIRATRLVGCNMCVRRDLLLEHGLDEDRARAYPDVTVSGRGDEEGLFLRLRSAGYEQQLVPDAIVVHHHPHTARSLFHQAYRGGRSAAKLVYKYHLPPRLDLLPFILAYITLPLMLLDLRLGVVPATLFVAAIIAITYNDLARKGKTIGETLISFPVLLVYYHVRLVGYVVQSIRLWLRLDRLERVRLK